MLIINDPTNKQNIKNIDLLCVIYPLRSLKDLGQYKNLLPLLLRYPFKDVIKYSIYGNFR